MKPFYREANRYRNIYVLCFPKSWIGTELPPSPKSREDYDDRDKFSPHAFEIELLDTLDGKIYKTTMGAHYEECEGGFYTVHEYMLADHYCSCNRKADAGRGGAITDDECDGRRFLVKSVKTPDWPNKLILYTETLDHLK